MFIKHHQTRWCSWLVPHVFASFHIKIPSRFSYFLHCVQSGVPLCYIRCSTMFASFHTRLSSFSTGKLGLRQLVPLLAVGILKPWQLLECVVVMASGYRGPDGLVSSFRIHHLKLLGHLILTHHSHMFSVNLGLLKLVWTCFELILMLHETIWL